MRVSPRELKAIRASGLITRYAILEEAVFVIVDLPKTGSSGTPIEDACRLEHWGLVLQAEPTLTGRTTRTFGPAEHRFQIRWEVFNVVNKANFNNPTSGLNSSNFGRILTAGAPRIMQFAFKYDF